MDQNITQSLDVNGLEGARVGIMRQLSDTPTTDPEFLALFNQAIGDIAVSGEHTSICRAHTLYLWLSQGVRLAVNWRCMLKYACGSEVPKLIFIVCWDKLSA